MRGVKASCCRKRRRIKGSTAAARANIKLATPIVAAAAIVPGVVALGVCIYQLSLPNVLFGFHYSTGNGYDDGVYLGAALRLVNGVLPYRDFVLLHPPGVPLLMTPIAVLGHIFGTRDAMALARLVTALVAAVSAALAAVAVRHWGIGAMVIAGTTLACYPLAVAADHTLLLEPYLVCFCLIGMIAMFTGGEIASSHRLVVAGIAFGFAGAIKVWAIVPILVAFAVCLPRWKAVRALALGTICGFVLPCLPFAVMAPRAFFHDVFVVQLAQAAPGTAGAPNSLRLLQLTGFWGISFLHSKTALALCVSVALVIFVALVYGWKPRSNTRADWFLLGSASGATTVMFLPHDFFDHYAYFPAAFVAMLVGSCFSRAVRACGTRDPRFIGRLGALVIPLVVSLLAMAVLVPEQLSFARSYLSSPINPGPTVSKFIPPGACVVSNVASVTIIGNRFDPAGKGCPAVVDPFGVEVATLPTHRPRNPTSYLKPFVATWGQWLNRADDVVLISGGDSSIPWTPELAAWFNRNFRLLQSLPNTFVYEHIGHAPPPSG